MQGVEKQKSHNLQLAQVPAGQCRPLQASPPTDSKYKPGTKYTKTTT